MEDQKHLSVNHGAVSKSRKKKPVPQHPEISQSHEIRTFSGQKGKKGTKRGLINEAPPLFQTERHSIQDSMPDSSTSGNEYRALRLKYLLLEEESCGLGKELEAVEDDIKTLEEEKLSLLDELVVLEGLIAPSDLQPRGQRLQ
ncbi:hypothetical protein ABFS83_10G032000 [Erythranthe nasuta]